jgi:hypothetical protein
MILTLFVKVSDVASLPLGRSDFPPTGSHLSRDKNSPFAFPVIIDFLASRSD